MNNNDKIDVITTYLGGTSLEEINEIAKEYEKRKYVLFKNEEEVGKFFGRYINDIYQNTSEEEKESFKLYSGEKATEIYAYTRRTWNQEENGHLFPELKKQLENIISNVRNSISKNETLPNNIVAYRRVNLRQFFRLGIYRKPKLTSLEGTYIIEENFTNTFLLHKGIEYDEKVQKSDRSDIELQYIIPFECQEAIPFITPEISGNTEFCPLTIDRDGLFKIAKVKYVPETDKTYITLLYIPRKVWNKNYEIMKENSR